MQVDLYNGRKTVGVVDRVPAVYMRINCTSDLWPRITNK